MLPAYREARFVDSAICECPGSVKPPRIAAWLNNICLHQGPTAMSGKRPVPPSMLFTRSSGPLLRFLTRRVGFQEAPDLLQESYLRVFRLAERETIAEPGALLHAIAINLVRDHLRRRKTERKYLDFERDADAEPAPNALPDASIEAEARLKLLVQAVHQLPPRCRQVFIMRRFDDLHQEEIAQRLGISRNMVEKHLRVALARLKSALD